MHEERRHAAIMFTDIVGYTALMGSDEDKAFAMLARNRTIQETVIKQFNGHLIKEIGDGILASFSLATDAVRCAMEIQKSCKEQNIPLKIAIHEGEMVFAGADVLGDGVNIASRLQEGTGKGCITISETVYHDVKNKPGIKTRFLEEKKYKNIERPIKIHQVIIDQSDEAQLLAADKKKKKIKWVMCGAAVLAGMILIVIALLWWKGILNLPSFPGTGATTGEKKSIAVLPFKNDSPDQENQYVCNGMMDEILNQLEKVGSLGVKSRTSVEVYRNINKDIKEIGHELEVSFILEGSVRKAGDNLRVTTQLIDARSGNHIWSNTYDGKYSDEIFAFQNNVAKEVAASLQVAITPKEKQRIKKQSTENFKAYDLCSHGNELVYKFQLNHDLKYIDSANVLFNQALELDPNYFRAFAGKMSACNMKGLYFYDKKSLDSAILYADKLIELDPEDERSYAFKGTTYQILGKADLAIEGFGKLLDLDPDDCWTNVGMGQVYVWQKNDVLKGLTYISKGLRNAGVQEKGQLFLETGYVYLTIGYYDKAARYFRLASEKHETCYRTITTLWWVLVVQGKLTESQHFLDSICKVEKCEQECLKDQFYNKLYRGDFEKAGKHLDQFLKAGGTLSDYDSIFLACLYQRTGREKQALSILNNSRKVGENRLAENKSADNLIIISLIIALQGDKPEAIRLLSEAQKTGPPGSSLDYRYLLLTPVYKDLHDEPGFKAIVKQAREKLEALLAKVKAMEELGEIDK